MINKLRAIRPVEWFLLACVALLISSVALKIWMDYPLVGIDRTRMPIQTWVGYVALVEGSSGRSSSGHRLEFRFEDNQKTAYLVCDHGTSSAASYRWCPMVKDLREWKKQDPHRYWYPVKVEGVQIDIPLWGRWMNPLIWVKSTTWAPPPMSVGQSTSP